MLHNREKEKVWDSNKRSNSGKRRAKFPKEGKRKKAFRRNSSAGEEKMGGGGGKSEHNSVQTSLGEGKEIGQFDCPVEENEEERLRS